MDLRMIKCRQRLITTFSITHQRKSSNVDMALFDVAELVSNINAIYCLEQIFAFQRDWNLKLFYWSFYSNVGKNVVAVIQKRISNDTWKAQSFYI